MINDNKILWYYAIKECCCSQVNLNNSLCISMSWKETKTETSGRFLQNAGGGYCLFCRLPQTLLSRLNEIADQCKCSSCCAHAHTEKTIQHELLWCNYFSFDMKNYSKSMGRKVFCSLSQEAALFTSLQHIICSISQSQLFSLSYCHTHSTTVYHSMPHLTRQPCAHARVCNPSRFCCCIVFSVYLFSFGCQLVFGSICWKINLPPVELCLPASLCSMVFYIPFTPWINM